MDKIDKALQKFTKKERGRVKQILKQISQGQFKGIDLKKLKGHSDVFRIRKGSLRIIYRQDNTGTIFILDIDRRTKRTYKEF